MLIVTYLFLVLIFGMLGFLLYKLTVIFLNYRKDVQNKEHYPIVLAMTLISIPMVVKYFSLDTFLISIINKSDYITLPTPKNDIYSFIFYFVYIFGMLGLSYIFYRLKSTDTHIPLQKSSSHEIQFPADEIIISPFLHERLKELFELKYEKQDLRLQYDEKENILIGEYSEAIHGYRFIIYCDTESKEVSGMLQSDILMRLEHINQEYTTENTRFYEVKYFFFIKKGHFEKHQSKLQCYDEDSYLNSMIDFKSYLKKRIELFDETLSDIGGQTLSKSFIQPNYNQGRSDLSKYLDTWLEEDTYKHITLLADYGMGKTTFLKYYTKYLAEKILEGKQFTRYPIFISLTNTSPYSNDGIETAVESFVARELGVNYALFERLVHLGKIVFILDGFDEMGFIGTEQIRFEQFNSIWKLATKNNKILISGRPSYLPTDFERENVLNIVDKEKQDIQTRPFTEVIELDYFKEYQIKKTLNIYYQDKKEAKQYMQYIKRNQSIFDLCKRPSMLHMTMFILPSLYEENPTARVTSSMIMSKYVDYWIGRQEEKGIVGVYNNNDKHKQEFIINFFTQLAGEMYENETLIVSKNKLDSLIAKEIKKSKLDIESNENTLEGFKNEIYTGYFIELDINKDAHFKFVHKSIFEYFVSRQIINIIKDKEFNHKLFRLDWSSEIIDFIDDSIENKEDKESKTPALIGLRNSWIDKILFIPYTKIMNKDKVLYLLYLLQVIMILFLFFATSFEQKEVVKATISFKEILIGILMVIVGLFIGKLIQVISTRLSFVEKAYYIDFIKRRTKITNKQLQYFFDFSFEFVVNLKFNNFTFNKLTIRDFTFSNSMVTNIIFKESSLNRLTFYNSQLDKIDFDSSIIKQMMFDKSILKNINFENATFKSWGKKDLKTLKYSVIYLIAILFLKKPYSLFRRRLSRMKPRIIFRDIGREDIDAYTIKQIRKLIQKNSMKRKDFVCDPELKDLFFSK